MRYWVLLLAAGAAYGQCDAQPDVRRLYSTVRNALESPGQPPGAHLAEYRTKLELHPDDPHYLYLYGLALFGSDSPQGARYMERAIEKAPQFPLPYLALAQLYGSGDFKDGAKAGQNMLAFSKLCPESVDGYPSLPAVTDLEPLRELARRFRKAVEGRDTVGVAESYRTLWAAEFRAWPGEFDRLREQVRKDMARAKELNPENASVQAAGYRLLGDENAAKALTVVPPPPRTGAEVITAWLKAHPYPTSGTREEKDAWTAARHAASAEWVRDWPNEANAWYWRMVTLNSVKPVDTKALEEAGERCLAASAKRPDIWYSRPDTLSVAQLWTEAGIRLKDSIALAWRAIDHLENGPAVVDDRRRSMTEAFGKQQAPILTFSRFEALAVIADASRKLNDPAGARAVIAEMKAWLDAHPAERSNGLERVYRQQEALQALSDERKLDALAHYQQMRLRNAATAIDTERVRALWAELGGSKDTFEAWWARPSQPKVADQPSKSWTEMNRAVGALNASGLDGRLWTVTDLKGKTTLINVWATWCEPCRRELPHLQALFDRLKDRKDLQVITIAIDENPGVVPPFLKANGFTFPVLLAKDFVERLMPEVSIPRNWVVDREGRLRSEYIGFDSKAEDWPGRVLGELERVARAH